MLLNPVKLGLSTSRTDYYGLPSHVPSISMAPCRPAGTVTIPQCARNQKPPDWLRGELQAEHHQVHVID